MVPPSFDSFLIGTENVMYFSLFSPIHSKSPSNSSANLFIITSDYIFYVLHLYIFQYNDNDLLL